MPRKGYTAPLLAAAMLCAAPSAGAVTSDRFEYEADQVGYYSITPNHLAPNSDDLDYFVEFSGMSGNNVGCFSTGVNLPQGALMASVQTWYTSDNQSDVIVQVVRTTLATSHLESLMFFDVNDDTGVRTSVTNTIDGPLRQVKNAQYGYSYTACVGPGSVFHGARIRYTYRNAGG